MVAPFANVVEDRIRSVILGNVRPSRPQLLHEDEVWALLQRCWDVDPEARPPFWSVHLDLKPFVQQLEEEAPPTSSSPAASVSHFTVYATNWLDMETNSVISISRSMDSTTTFSLHLDAVEGEDSWGEEVSDLITGNV